MGKLKLRNCEEMQRQRKDEDMGKEDIHKVIFRAFRTYGGKYVYDRHSDSVIAVNDEEFEEFCRVERGDIKAEDSPAVRKYRKQGLFMSNIVKKIEHPQTEILEHDAEYKLHQLILQVTQQCNLRCEYCAYSGIYEGSRTHSSRRMTFDTAKRAIDFFLDHSLENSDISIGFYGGEPLLEFDLIRQCVKYVKENCEGKRVRFSMTTNGTLLKGERADFVAENEFSTSISLDGAKEEHDACRKFPDGTGSFDIVIKNVENLMKRYPEYSDRHVNFFTTVNPYMDLNCVLNYFKAGEIIRDSSVMYNTMVPVNLRENVTYKESYFQVKKFEYIKVLLSMVGKLDDKYVSRLVNRVIDKSMELKKALHNREALYEIMHPGGPCLPGVLRLFVRYDGNFFPCERVNETLEFYRIGSVEEGLDLDKMWNLLNIGKLTEEECRCCWNLRHCLLCANEIEFHGKEAPAKKEKLAVCKAKKAQSECDLYEQAVLKEFGYVLPAERI